VTRFGNEGVNGRATWSSVSVAMKARPQKPGSGDVRGLMAELSDLVDDLGLHDTDAPAPAKPEPPATPDDQPATTPASPPLSAPPPPSAPVWRSGPEVLTGSAASSLESHLAVPAPETAEAAPALVPVPEPVDAVDAVDAVPMWESAAADPATAGLWEAFSPELAAEPPRPWSPAAATAVIESAAPPDRPRTAPAHYPAPAVPLLQRRPHAFTVVTSLAVVVAAAVFAFSRLDLGHTTGPATAVTHTAFIVDGVRTVAARSAAEVSSARTTDSFPASATAVYLDITYRNVTPSDTLKIVILLQPQHPGEPVVTVSDETHGNLASSGEIAVTVEAPPGGFTPGTYAVRAFHDDNLEQTTSFTVAPPS